MQLGRGRWRPPAAAKSFRKVSGAESTPAHSCPITPFLGLPPLRPSTRESPRILPISGAWRAASVCLLLGDDGTSKLNVASSTLVSRSAWKAPHVGAFVRPGPRLIDVAIGGLHRPWARSTPGEGCKSRPSRPVDILSKRRSTGVCLVVAKVAALGFLSAAAPTRVVSTGAARATRRFMWTSVASHSGASSGSVRGPWARAASTFASSVRSAPGSPP